MRRLIKESEHLKGLLSELPSFLQRRVTLFDLEWIDKNLNSHISHMPGRIDFDEFCDFVLGDLLHEFLVYRKDDEINNFKEDKVNYNQKNIILYIIENMPPLIIKVILD